MAAASHAARLPGLTEELARALPRPLVFTNGVFDILHAGHVDCLEQARALGASLVVGVNGDASARRLGKGAGRPINRQGDRLRVVEALAAVSAALLFDEDAPLTLLRALRPDIYVKGGDYRASDLPEARLVAQWEGCTVIIPRRVALSTTALIERAARARTAVAA
jgi:rfaE bifunctional protein nucleotidyltransferase chain/domain